VGQQYVQPVDGLGARVDQVLAVFHDSAQSGDGSVDRRCVKPGGSQCRDTDRDRVGLVGLAAVSGGEHPHSSGQFGGHVGHGDAVGMQRLGQGGAQAGCAFDSPARVAPALSEPPQPPITLWADVHPDDVHGLQRGIDRAAVHDALCGSTAITTRSVRSASVTGWYSSLRWTMNEWREGIPTTALQASLEPLPANGADPGRKPSKLRANPREAAGMRVSDPEPAPRVLASHRVIVHRVFGPHV
jgi:hypothetical protein